jgi:large subunit ribosomal protein L29
MKNAELKSLSLEELNEKIGVEEEAMLKLRFAHAISPLENPMKLRETRRTIARLKTELRARQFSN